MPDATGLSVTLDGNDYMVIGMLTDVNQGVVQKEYTGTCYDKFRNRRFIWNHESDRFQ